MFNRLRNWLNSRKNQGNNQSAVVRTDAQCRVTAVRITQEQADAIEALMNPDGMYFVVVKSRGQILTLTHNIDYRTMLNELYSIASEDKMFKDELTNMIIDLNR